MGRDMARCLAFKGYDLILVARREDRLRALQKEIKNVNVRIITLDLSIEENCLKLYELTRDEHIDFLINNAGFGVYGRFTETSLDRELTLIKTNVIAVHMLTKLFVKDMKERGSGNILNVGSIAGFLPGPLLSSYYASKNYVVRLSEAVHEELRREGSRVKVSVLCPGPVKTEFNQVAGVNFIVEGLKSSYVARYAIDKALKGKMVIIPSVEKVAVSNRTAVCRTARTVVREGELINSPYSIICFKFFRSLRSFCNPCRRTFS